MAHELTHAITLRRPLKGHCDDYQWFAESTRKWAEHVVYPNADSEHPWAHVFFGRTPRSLDEKTLGEVQRNGYAAYIFPLYPAVDGQGAHSAGDMARIRDP